MEVDGSQRAMPRASVEDRQLSMNDLKAANNKFAGYTLFLYKISYSQSDRWSKTYSKFCFRIRLSRPKITKHILTTNDLLIIFLILCLHFGNILIFINISDSRWFKKYSKLA